MSDLVGATDGAPGGTQRWQGERQPLPLADYVIALAVVVGVTLPALLCRPFLGARTVALVYLLSVVILALFAGRGPVLVAAGVSALFWDFFFLEPITQLRITNPEDAAMCGVYFVVVVVVGQLTARIRAEERVERQREEHTSALYQLTQELSEAAGLDQLVQTAIRQLERTFHARIAILLPDSSGALGRDVHPASTYDLTGPEQPVARWAFEHRQPAGKFAGHLSEGDTLFVPLSTSDGAVGVMGLTFEPAHPMPSLLQRRLLDAYAQQIALAIERQRLRERSESAKLLVESERLSKTLLNSMSHEIRTPLAAIQGAVGNLLELDEPRLSPAQQAMVAEVQQAAGRLNRLVGKVLDITRLESGTVKPRLVPCDVTDLIHTVVKETRSEMARHKLEVDLAPNLPLVGMDFVLVQEALKNLLSNAATHTPAGTVVQLRARMRDGALQLTVADRGPGIPPESLPRIFHKFYRAPGAPTGGTGLGLSLVKGFVEAQGGEVAAENREGGGALFTIRLPCTKLAR